MEEGEGFGISPPVMFLILSFLFISYYCWLYIDYKAGKKAEKERQKNHELQLKKEKEREENELKEATTYFQKGGLTNLRKALKIYTYYGYDTRNNKIEIGKEKERLLDFKGALSIFKQLGLHRDAKRIRQKMRDEGKVKVDQTVVHGDYVDDRDTIVKDSVINRSNVGGGSDDKIAKLEKIAEMKDKGIIDDDEFKQMKKEILGK